MSYSKERYLKPFKISIELDDIVINTIIYDYDEESVLDSVYYSIQSLYPELIHKFTKSDIKIIEGE